MSGNKKPRSNSAGIGKITITPPPAPQRSARNTELTRKARITKLVDGEQKEFEISYDELKHGDLLGRGQFGTVRKMFHPPSELTFAVKMINDDLMESSSDKQNAEIMDLEVPLRMGDGCPYLIKFYGALHAEAYIWILTEVMDTSLDRFYSKVFALTVPMPQLFLSKVAFSVVTALDFMRNLKLMHRDIKPSNILLNATGEIKVCDFGISGFTKNSVCNTIKGCQIYMPPEKIDPRGTGYSIKADVWSLGISMIEIATNEHPYKDIPGLLGLIRKIANEPSPKLDTNQHSPEFCEFVDKCLIKNPEERASCATLLSEPFITKYLNEPIDVDFMKTVIDKVKADPVEA